MTDPASNKLFLLLLVYCLCITAAACVKSGYSSPTT